MIHVLCGGARRTGQSLHRQGVRQAIGKATILSLGVNRLMKVQSADGLPSEAYLRFSQPGCGGRFCLRPRITIIVTPKYKCSQMSIFWSLDLPLIQPAELLIKGAKGALNY